MEPPVPNETDEFELQYDDALDKFHKRKLERGRATTANIITFILVGGILLSMLLYTVTCWFCPDVTSKFDNFFDNWLKYVSPLAETAVGFYFGSHQNKPT